MKVFVSVGTTKFDELINLFDDNTFTQNLPYINELTIQYGHSKQPQQHNIPLNAFSLTNKFKEYVEQSDLVISTASAGVRLDVIEAKKPHIIIANRALHGDHQKEMVDALQGNKSVKGFLSTVDLQDFLLQFNEE